jgi:hypothetical protein
LLLSAAITEAAKYFLQFLLKNKPTAQRKKEQELDSRQKQEVFFLFLKAFITALEFKHPFIQAVFPTAEKQLDCENDHLAPSTAKIKNT